MIKIKTQKTLVGLAIDAQRGKTTFKARVFKDGTGDFSLNCSDGFQLAEDSGNIKEWLQYAKDMQKSYQTLEEFLIVLQDAHRIAKGSGEL